MYLMNTVLVKGTEGNLIKYTLINILTKKGEDISLLKQNTMLFF